MAPGSVPGAARPHELRAFGLTLRVKRPSAFGASILAVVLAVAFVGLLTYYGARKFTRDAADLRASEEALSLAEQSAYTATGDAFAGYLQILRYAEDPAVREITSTHQQRVDAMQQLLYLNTNKLSALAIVARDGTIFATTDPAIDDVRDSEAFNKTRANLHPTNSDIVLPGESGRGYVEFTTPLTMPDGSVWAILYARADPDVLWRTTLRTSVDGSRNVIINSNGQFAAGVPDELLRQPWRGSPLDNGGVRADIVGVDSICGLGSIGAQTQIDHGFYVASCLPISIIHTEATRAMGQQVLVTVSGAVLAIVIAGGALWVMFNGSPPAAGAVSNETVPSEQDELLSRIARYRPPEPAQAPGDEDSAPPVQADAPPADEQTAAEVPAPAPQPTIVADVDALRIIDAYERRSARLAQQLRESVQARLMIASAQADEAFRLHDVNADSAAALHRAAIEEMEAIRDRELRALGQEMHPGLVRLGLPGALRALQKELRGTITLNLDVDPESDSAADGDGRIMIDGARRLVVIRAVRGAIVTMRDAGASRCDLTLLRDGDWLRLTIAAAVDEPSFPEDALAADSLTFAAYGGRLTWSREDEAVIVTAELPAPGVEAADDGVEAFGETEVAWEEDSEAVEEAAPARPAPVVTFPAALQADGESLAGALRDLAAALPEFEMSLDVADDFERADMIDAELAGTLRSLVGTAARALHGAGARACSVTLRHIHDDVYLSMMSDEGGDALDLGVLSAAKQGIEARGGQISIGHFEGSATITVEIPGGATSATPRIIQLERAPIAAADAAPDGTDDAGDAPQLDFGPGGDDDGGSGEDAA